MERNTSRREFLLAAGGVSAGIGLGAVIVVEPARATPAATQEAIRKVVGSARINPGKVKLELPPRIAQNAAMVITTMTLFTRADS